MTATPHSRPWGWRTTHRGIEMRSRLEVALASWMDRHRIAWLYEAETFTLSEDRRYTPDFHLPEVRSFVECKGVLRLRDREALSLFAPVADAMGHNLIVSLFPAGEELRLVTRAGHGPAYMEPDLELSRSLVMALCDACRRWWFALGPAAPCPGCGAWEKDGSHVAAIHPHDGSRAIPGDMCPDCGQVEEIRRIVRWEGWRQ